MRYVVTYIHTQLRNLYINVESFHIHAKFQAHFILGFYVIRFPPPDHLFSVAAARGRSGRVPRSICALWQPPQKTSDPAVENV